MNSRKLIMIFDVIDALFEDLSFWENLKGGFSDDDKYLVSTYQSSYILRLSDISELDRKKYEYEKMKLFHDVYPYSSASVSYGTYKNYSYLITSWIEGKHLKRLSDEEYYRYGIKAGEIQKEFSKIEQFDKSDDFYDKYLNKLNKYLESDCRIENDEVILEFIYKNIDILKDRPAVLAQGDYHIKNMLITETGELAIIDFDRIGKEDPYEAFYKMQLFEPRPFAKGHLDGYFNHEIPETFWKIQAVYVAIGTLSSIVWAQENFGKREVDKMIKRAQQAALDYQNYELTIPEWYSR